MGVSEGSEPDSGVVKAVGCSVEVVGLSLSLSLSLSHLSLSHLSISHLPVSIYLSITLSLLCTHTHTCMHAACTQHAAQLMSHGACPNMFGAVSQSELRIELDQSEQLHAIFRTSSRRSEELEQQQPPFSKAAGDQTGKFSLFLS